MSLRRQILLIKMKKIHLSLVMAFVMSFVFYIKSKGEPEILQENHIKLPNYEVHIFYEAGFRTATVDGQFRGWSFNPNAENSINSAYYPAAGLYSSNDKKIIDQHMKQIYEAGVGVVVVSWWPETSWKSPPMDLILNSAQKHHLKVTIQIQNYSQRSVYNLRSNIKQFFEKYGKHPALYKTKPIGKNTEMPLIYIYDAQLIIPAKWTIILGYSGNYSLRGTDCDAIYIGTIEDDVDQMATELADMDGIYTFLSHSNYSYATSWYRWPYIQDFAREKDMIFVPTVNPGYDNRLGETKYPYANRHDGAFYETAWYRAIISRSKYVAINSFNGWLEGTQIEPAQTKPTVLLKGVNAYQDYNPHKPEQYLKLTRNWVIRFTNVSYHRSL